MALSASQHRVVWLKWLVSLFAIAAIWRVGVYGVDWKTGNGVVTLLIVIAVLALCISLWKPKRVSR